MMNPGQPVLQQDDGIQGRFLTKNISRSAGIALLLLAIYAAATSLHFWSDEKSHTITTLQTIAALESKGLAAYFTQLELDLEQLAEDLTSNGDRIDLGQAFARLKRFKNVHPELYNATLIRPDGQILLTARSPPGSPHASLAKEPSFVEFLNELKRGKTLAIGQPLMGVVSNAAIVPVRRAIHDRWGQLQYIVSANLPHEYLRGFWMEAPITSEAAIGLMRDSGYLLSRYPVPAGQTLAQIYGQPRSGALIQHLRQKEFPQSGYVQGPSSLDGPDFLTVFQRLPNHSLTLFVAMPMAKIRASWWKRVSETYWILLVVVAGGWIAYRQALHRQAVWTNEHNRLETARHQSEARLRSLFGAMGEGVVLQDSGGHIVEANPAAETLLGLSRDQLLGKTSMDPSWQAIHEDGTPFPGDDHPAMVTLRTGQPLRNQIMGVQAGTVGLRWLRINSSPVGSSSDSAPKAVVATFADISDKKHAEDSLQLNRDLLRSVIEGTSDAVYAKDRDGRYTLFNTAAARFVGQDVATAIGRDDTALFPAAEAAAVMAGDRAVMASRTTQTYEERVTTADGRLTTFMSTKGALLNRKDEVIGLFGIARDVTDLKRLQEEALTARILSAQEGERARLAHELHDDVGQSLTALNLMLQHARRICVNENAGDYLHQATDETQALIAAIRRIAYELRPAQLDELGLMSALRWHLDKIAPMAGLTYRLGGNLGETRLPTDLNLCCFRIAQEALNNVIKHAQASNVELKIDSTNGRLKLLIRDDGIGFDDSAANPPLRAPGSLGLLNMRERAAALGGKVMVSSVPGEGTEVLATFAWEELSA